MFIPSMFHAMPLGFLPNLVDSPMDLIIVLIIAVLLFGKRLPEIGKSVGRTIVEFKKGLNQTGEELKNAAHEEPTQVQEKPMMTASTVKAPRQVKQIPSTMSATAEEP